MQPRIATLFFVHNGAAATTLGSAAAVLSAFLYGYGVLPNLFGAGWCSVIGATTYFFTLVFWRSRQLVFLDRICISQTDEQLKGEALISLGAFLKCADSMLVLWDPTYMERLWTLFELAAFMHSRQRGMKLKLTIRPTLLGPLFLITICSLILVTLINTFAWGIAGWDEPSLEVQGTFLGFICLVSSSAFLVTAHMGRAYCRAVEKVHDEIAVFSVDKLKSYCCSVDHTDPATGETFACDRNLDRFEPSIFSPNPYVPLGQGCLPKLLLQDCC